MNSSLSPEWLPSFLTPFVTLSYPTDPPAVPDSFNNSPYYDAGLLDGCFIITCIAVMAVLRDALRLGVFEPFARWYLTRELLKSKALQNGHASRDEKKNVGSSPKANGAGNGVVQGPESVVITRKEARLLNRSVMRFAEQGWSFVYYTLQWLYGLVRLLLIHLPASRLITVQYVHYNLPTRVINPVDVWTDYPHIRLAGPLKFYYLTQTAFYMHQVLILNAEARRKDHWQMMAHHVITIGLVLGSYSYHFTRIGCLVMMLMDCCDIFLPVSVTTQLPRIILTGHSPAAGKNAPLPNLRQVLRCHFWNLSAVVASDKTLFIPACHQVYDV